MNGNGHRVSGRLAALSSFALLLGLGAGANAQLGIQPGHYTGTWFNNTFSSSGAIRADVTIQGGIMKLVVDVDGGVFGGTDPAPFTLSGPISGAGWSATLNGEPVFGDMQASVNGSGVITASGTNVPSPFVASYTETGTITGGTIHIDMTVQLEPSGTADVDINMTRSSFNTLVSANPIIDGAFGYSVGAVADVNGDNRSDIIVGAPRETVNGKAEGGRAYVFNGTTGALIRTLVSPGNEVGGRFGVSVAGIPDVNGDGRGDIVVGAPGEDPGASPDNCGRAYIFSGATGALLWKLIPPTPETDGNFGHCVAGVADVNGDGRGDVIVGAPDEDPGASPLQAGRVYVYSGATGVRLRTLTAPVQAANDFYGGSVSGVPDVNGDGRGEILVGSAQGADGAPLTNKPGRAYLYSGANGGLMRVFNSPGAEANGMFGDAVSGIPDVNGDGRGDVVIGAFEEDPGAHPDGCGRAYIFNGVTGALLWKLIPPTPENHGAFGDAVAGVADVNGDGRGDVIVGAPEEGPSGLNDAGRVYIYSGATGVRLQTILSPYSQTMGNFGVSVAGATDVNGNGRGDVIIGAFQEAPGLTPSQNGRAYILRK